MKRWYSFIVAILLVLTMTACQGGATGSATTEPTEDDGVLAYESAGKMSYILSEIPYDLMLSDVAVPLVRVSFFEEYDDHGYFPYVVITLSRENLSDDDIYWMTKYDNKKFCKELDVNLYVNSDTNKLESDPLVYIGAIYDEENIYFSFYGEKGRYSYLGSEFSCQIIHAPTGLTESDTVYYYYRLLIDDNNHFDSNEGLTESERNAFYQAIDNYLEN